MSLPQTLYMDPGISQVLRLEWQADCILRQHHPSVFKLFQCVYTLCSVFIRLRMGTWVLG